MHQQEGLREIRKYFELNKNEKIKQHIKIRGMQLKERVQDNQ